MKNEPYNNFSISFTSFKDEAVTIFVKLFFVKTTGSHNVVNSLHNTKTNT